MPTRTVTTLINSFHNTEYRTTKTPEEMEAIGHAVFLGLATKSEKAFVRRAWKALCGMDDCKCSDCFGQRAR